MAYACLYACTLYSVFNNNNIENIKVSHFNSPKSVWVGNDWLRLYRKTNAKTGCFKGMLKSAKETTVIWWTYFGWSFPMNRCHSGCLHRLPNHLVHNCRWPELLDVFVFAIHRTILSTASLLRLSSYSLFSCSFGRLFIHSIIRSQIIRYPKNYYILMDSVLHSPFNLLNTTIYVKCKINANGISLYDLDFP